MPNLVKNKDIVIQKADKANNIIKLNRSDYILKLSNILEGTSKFKRVDIEEGKALYHLGEISEKEKKDLYSSSPKLGVLYGFAKIHKTLEDGTLSFRLILSAIETPTYNLVKFCNRLLNPLTRKDYIMTDSFSHFRFLFFRICCFIFYAKF